MNQPVPSITCDTPGCDTTLAAFDFELLSYRAGIAVAAEQGWRHGPDRLRRCPACVTKGWPGCMPGNGELPDPALYNDLTVLYAWCDATYGPLRQPPENPWRTVTVWHSQDTTATEAATI